LFRQLINLSQTIHFHVILIEYIAGYIFRMRYLFTLLGIFCSSFTFSQAPSESEKPKLVVGIIVDQMRYEFLNRYAPKFGNGGFKRLINEGFSLRNGHYNYIPTRTALGHASVFTGTTPGVHGIIGNDWYDKIDKRRVNCVTDSRQKAVGVTNGRGDVSPWRMLTTTISDELKLSTQKRSKVIGISLKDRGAVLPAGHMADGAYWFDIESGNFISSTYYMQKLPAWVDKFNALKLPDQYLQKEWNTVYPIEQYVESGPDNNPYEGRLWGKETPTFPYKLKELRKKGENYDMLQFVPFGNDFTLDMAKAAIDGARMGQGQETDFLAISFSSTDKMGHEVGPNAIEIEDIYIRLDKNIEELLNTLDAKIGKGKYTLFLTSDHGIPDISQYLTDNKIPAGYYRSQYIKASLNDHLKKYFPGKEIVEAVENEQVFFNQEAFQSDPKSSGVELLVATELVINFLLQQEGVANAFSEIQMRQGRFDEGGIKGMIIRGFHPKRSGDVMIQFEPNWYEVWKPNYTDHGTGYAYDTHVPVMFFGNGIKKGSTVRYYAITDIAPTICTLLNIRFPNGCIGQPIEEIFEK
jgi:predicted AlkP superfamily pyrophosphatase or phosphodiesterase